MSVVILIFLSFLTEFIARLFFVFQHVLKFAISNLSLFFKSVFFYKFKIWWYQNNNKSVQCDFCPYPVTLRVITYRSWILKLNSSEQTLPIYLIQFHNTQNPAIIDSQQPHHPHFLSTLIYIVSCWNKTIFILHQNMCLS